MSLSLEIIVSKVPVFSVQSRQGVQRPSNGQQQCLLLDSSAIVASAKSGCKKQCRAAMCCYGMFLRSFQCVLRDCLLKTGD